MSLLVFAQVRGWPSSLPGVTCRETTALSLCATQWGAQCVPQSAHAFLHCTLAKVAPMHTDALRQNLQDLGMSFICVPAARFLASRSAGCLLCMHALAAIAGVASPAAWMGSGRESAHCFCSSLRTRCSTLKQPTSSIWAPRPAHQKIICSLA